MGGGGSWAGRPGPRVRAVVVMGRQTGEEVGVLSGLFLTHHPTVDLLCPDGDGSFRANRGFETIKTVGE